MANIAIIDADLIGKKKHRFPNLACMKISGYQKEQGNEVTLKLDYDNLSAYDQIFISKVFTDTSIDSQILQMKLVKSLDSLNFIDSLKVKKKRKLWILIGE